MIFDILSRTNFLDILIAIVLFRICYIAAKTGFSIEIFKLFGVLFATFISFHYYTDLSGIILRILPQDLLPSEFIDALMFCILAALGYLSFFCIRITFYRFMKLEALPAINKWGGFFLGMFRGYLTVGLLVFILFISNIDYFSGAVKHSYFGGKVFLISPDIYSWQLNNIFSKFSTKEKFNPAVKEVMHRFNRK